jgi:hypothetical protein
MCEKFHLVTFEIFSDQGWREKDRADSIFLAFIGHYIPINGSLITIQNKQKPRKDWWKLLFTNFEIREDLLWYGI